AERGRALKKISKYHKPVDDELYTENFHVSQTFANKQLIKYMVTRFSVEKRRELYLTRNDKERVRAECRGVVLVFSNNGPSDPSGSNNAGLSDGPSGSQTNVDKAIRLDSKRKIQKRAGSQWNVRNCTTSFLSREIEQTIKPNPKIPRSALKDQLQKKYEIRILTAVGVDPNNGTYPLAYVVVDSENKQSWLRFLDCLGDDLELFGNSNFTGKRGLYQHWQICSHVLNIGCNTPKIG
ncbi:transposase, MuDR, partial [Tanacetum coccineum]